MASYRVRPRARSRRPSDPNAFPATGQNGVADTLQLITGGQSVWSVQPEKDTWVSAFPCLPPPPSTC